MRLNTDWFIYTHDPTRGPIWRRLNFQETERLSDHESGCLNVALKSVRKPPLRIAAEVSVYHGGNQKHTVLNLIKRSKYATRK